MADSEPTPLFPVFLDLRGRLCIVIGDGERAEKKARALIEAGGNVAVIGARPTDAVMESGTEGELTVERRGYVRGDLERAFLVLCLGQGEEVSRAVAAEAHDRGCLINVSGMPELCNFIIPATVGRGPLRVAVSTGGAAPEAARLARDEISGALGDEWAAYAGLLGEVREALSQRGATREESARVLERAGDRAVLGRIAAGESVTVEDLLAEPASADGEAAPETETESDS